MSKVSPEFSLALTITTIHHFFSRHSHIYWALADQAMVSGVNFFTGVLLARFLGIEEFGRFTLSWMAVLFVNSIQMAMISAPMMSIGPKQTAEDEASYYGSVMLQQLCFGALTFVLLWGGVKLSKTFYPEWHIDQLALPLAAVGLFFQTQDFLRRFFYTRGRHVAAFLNDAISYLGQLTLLVALFLSVSLNTSVVLWVIAATSAVAVLAGVFSLGDISWGKGFLINTFFRHWQFSKWMTASALLQWTSGNFFIVVAGSILGAGAVGALKATQNIMAVSHILFQGLENIVPVRASQYYFQHGIGSLLDYLKKTLLWGGLATAVIALAAGAFPEIWLSLFYGTEYVDYGFMLQWYAGIYLLIFLGFPLRTGLRTLEMPKSIFFAYVFMTFFSLCLAKPIVNFWGIGGVMFGILGNQIISNLSLFCSLHLKIRKMK